MIKGQKNKFSFEEKEEIPSIEEEFEEYKREMNERRLQLVSSYCEEEARRAKEKRKKDLIATILLIIYIGLVIALVYLIEKYTI